MIMELAPIGAILALLTKQVIKTAQAATDVVFEKESFKVLSKHLFDIEPVLRELQLKNPNDSEAARQALEFLETDVRKATNLVNKYKDCARFYLLIKCRHIVKEVQNVTRDIGKSLAALSLANVDVLQGVSKEAINRLQDEMQRAEFEACLSRLQIVDKLNQGLTEQKLNQGFANNILEEIARAVGVPVEPTVINKEMKSFRREMEEAANRKEKAEVLFLEQVIELLSRADAARDYEEIRKQYFQRLQIVEQLDPKDRYIEQFKAFTCCITGKVMEDPVSLSSTGTTCERSALKAWLEQGETTDPDSGEPLSDFSYRPNLQLSKSILEWKELNYCVGIRSCKGNLLSDIDSVEVALGQLQGLIRENPINKDWISIAGLTDIIISILPSTDSLDVKEKILITLKELIEENPTNKDKLVELGGFEYIIPCLILGRNMSEAAVDLLYELLHVGSSWKASFCEQLCKQSNAVEYLVAIHIGGDNDEKAGEILTRLFEGNELATVRAAKTGWYEPLVGHINRTGSESLRVELVRGIVSMELNERDLKLLGEEGLIPSLLEMASGNIESKEISLSALSKLSICKENKNLIASSGGVPLVIKLMCSFQFRTFIINKCLDILEKLSSRGDGTRFFVDENGMKLDQESIVGSLFAFLQNPRPSYTLHKPALYTLLAILKSESELIEECVFTSDGVSLVLPFLDNSDPDIKKAAINLLYIFSEYKTEANEYLQRPLRIETLMGFLDNRNRDAQMAAAGLLANLMKSERLLIKKLIELNGLKAIVNALRTGAMDVKENILTALFPFTDDPTDVDSQRYMVELGAYPLLVSLVKEGSDIAKERAACLIANLSSSTPKLTVFHKRANNYWCFSYNKLDNRLCCVHGGLCTVSTTFCMLEANALPELVNVLIEKVEPAAFQAIRAISTLIWNDSCVEGGAWALHGTCGIRPLLEVLNWGTDSLKEEALRVLEKVFMCREMVEYYGLEAKEILSGLMISCQSNNIHISGNLPREGLYRVLLLVERRSRSSSSLNR
ncbi:U-box domain-containing protein 44-like [Impatiens glandulifera]|uniref:U-box domain-containing protein 44-like n=1 Tax=Impatiens glandulifera TaxID=253017 RepID=UPI001FB0F13D|nr:U-box domain-containing protein 44-like [Impatiens glandulifera]